MLEAVTLRNDVVVLEPLDSDHAAALLAGIDEELWSGLTSPMPATVDDMSTYIKGLTNDDRRYAFAVRELSSNAVVGSTCLYDYAPQQERIELGSTFYFREVWGTKVNPACKLLLFEYAFEVLGVYRVGLRCDTRNVRSAAAIRRLGATEEGVFRGHRIAADGSRGDTLYFSVLAPEWRGVRSRLVERLA